MWNMGKGLERQALTPSGTVGLGTFTYQRNFPIPAEISLAQVMICFSIIEWFSMFLETSVCNVILQPGCGGAHGIFISFTILKRMPPPIFGVSSIFSLKLKQKHKCAIMKSTEIRTEWTHAYTLTLIVVRFLLLDDVESCYSKFRIRMTVIAIAKSVRYLLSYYLLE